MINHKKEFPYHFENAVMQYCFKLPSSNEPFRSSKLVGLRSALFTISLGTIVISGCSTVVTEIAPTSKASQAAIAALEKKYDAAIGVSLRDAEGKVLLEWRSRERFPLTSTVKALECARVYELGLENHYAPIKTTPIVPHSPVYGKVDPDTQVTLKEACRAALSQSDNRAANFIFVHTGGPKALTEWLRQKGDNTTRSDRLEPDLNLSGKNEYRDTTTPSNASLNWQRFDTQLPESARSQWLADLAANQMAGNLFRSRLPENWTLYDRSGAGYDEFCATRANHAILVTDKGVRYYAAVHLKAPAGTTMEKRDTILQQAIEVVYAHLLSR